MSNKCCKKTSIGGQAVIEGVMMKGPKRTVLAVRGSDGNIVVEDVDCKPVKNKFLKLPIIRGVVGFVNSMLLGYKTLMRSADLSGMTDLEEEQDKQKMEKKAEKLAAKKGISKDEALEIIKCKSNKAIDMLLGAVMVIASVLGVLLAVALFIYAPSYVFDLIQKVVSTDITKLAPLFEGILKVILFVGYILLVSQMNDIKRVFKYHGAEHKTIFCYEAGLELTVENVKKQIRFHPRCGTSFMFLMIAVSILVSTILVLIFPDIREVTYVWGTIKLLLVPLFCGLGYELIKLCGKYDNIATRIIAAPGLWIQRITTKEPDDDMIEVAIESLKPVIPENGEDIIG